jgi:hypothetical protein
LTSLRRGSSGREGSGVARSIRVWGEPGRERAGVCAQRERRRASEGRKIKESHRIGNKWSLLEFA